MATAVEAISPIMRDLQRRPRVLVVEDDPDQARYLVENLTADQMDVTAVDRGDRAITLLRQIQPDIALVDDGLPDMSGLDLIAHIRAGDPGSAWDADAALIVVTGRSDARHAVRCIGRGADDYVVKPFDYPELLARMIATLRRTSGTMFAERLTVGRLMVDCKALTAWSGDHAIPLCSKEFSLLVALARDPGRTMSKAELLHDVWGFASHSNRTRTLDTHASRLRRKLEAAGIDGLVHNVWGFGYRLLPVGR